MQQNSENGCIYGVCKLGLKLNDKLPGEKAKCFGQRSVDKSQRFKGLNAEKIFKTGPANDGDNPVYNCSFAFTSVLLKPDDGVQGNWD